MRALNLDYLRDGYVSENCDSGFIDYECDENGEIVCVEWCDITLVQPCELDENGEPCDYEIIGYRSCKNDKSMTGFCM